MRSVQATVRKLLWPAGVPSLLVALLAAGCAEPERAVRRWGVPEGVGERCIRAG